jgi:hypothetical protein
MNTGSLKMGTLILRWFWVKKGVLRYFWLDLGGFWGFRLSSLGGGVKQMPMSTGSLILKAVAILRVFRL